MKIFTSTMLMISLFSTLVVARTNSGAPNLCPKYRCVAQSQDFGGPVPGANGAPGFGYGDELIGTKDNAVQLCERISESIGSCKITSCERFTGPAIPIFSCESQWPKQ